MEVTKMDKAVKVYEKVKQLDLEIIELDKVAMQLANDDTEVSLDFKLVNHSETEKKEGLSVIEQMEKAYKFESYTFSFLSPYGSASEKKKEDATKFTHSVSTNNALKILGLLLSDKLEKRERLLNKLKSYGVKL